MNLPDNIVQAIVADIMDTGKLGEAWSAIDSGSRYIIMDAWRTMVRQEIESAFNDFFFEN